MDYYSNAYALNQYFASKGYVVLSVNYRSGIGYGLQFREALNYGAGGASEVNDVIGAGLYLRNRTDVDSATYCIVGRFLRRLSNCVWPCKSSNIFACGVDIHGVHNWNTEIPTWLSSYNPKRKRPLLKKLTNHHPLPIPIRGNLLYCLFIGDDDRNVPFNETITLMDKLREKGVHTEQLILPDEVHDILLHSNWLKVYHATYDFISRQFKQ
jgi:acetyl esterase/lipase